VEGEEKRDRKSSSVSDRFRFFDTEEEEEAAESNKTESFGE
jgi:hypothetical protein